MRWQLCLDHANKIQKPAESPDCLFGVVIQPADSRLSETTAVVDLRRRQRRNLKRHRVFRDMKNPPEVYDAGSLVTLVDLS